MTRLADLELTIEDIPEHAAADAWKRLNIIAEAYISDGHQDRKSTRLNSSHL